MHTTAEISKLAESTRPDDAEAHVLLGMARRGQQEYDDAKAHLDKAIELDPRNGRAYFEMGLLWPGLMGRFGAAYGIPFAVEGLFFFLEAIFVAIYIYGWDRLRPWPHFWTGVPVVLSGVGGTASVVAANAWMNTPGGISVRDGRVVGVRPLQVFFTEALWHWQGDRTEQGERVTLHWHFNRGILRSLEPKKVDPQMLRELRERFRPGSQ